MQKKTLAALAAPTLALALGLSACGGGSAPGLAGASSASSTPSVAPSLASPSASSTPQSSTAESSSAGPESSATSESSPAGGADIEAATETFIKGQSGFTKLPGAQVKATFAQAKAAIDPIKVDPAACKNLMLKSVDALPSDLDISLAIKPASGGATTVTYFGNGVQYVKDIKGIYDEMAANCKGMKQEVSGVKLTVTLEAWSPEGVDADNVYGTTETSVMPTQKIVQTKVFGTVGDTAFQVQVMDNEGGAAAQAQAAELAKAAVAALKG